MEVLELSIIMTDSQKHMAGVIYELKLVNTGAQDGLNDWPTDTELCLAAALHLRTTPGGQDPPTILPEIVLRLRLPHSEKRPRVSTDQTIRNM